MGKGEPSIGSRHGFPACSVKPLANLWTSASSRVMWNQCLNILFSSRWEIV